MSGRLENEQKIKNHFEQRVKKYNAQVQEYFYNLEQNKTATTVKTYMSNIFLFMDFQEKQRKTTDVHKINETHLNKYFNSISLMQRNGNVAESSYSRKALAWNALNSYFRYFIKKKDLKHNPMDCIEAPKKTNKEQKKVLTVDELKLIEHCICDDDDFIAYRDIAIFFVLKDTGMRIGALCNMNIEDVLIEEKKIRIVDKGNKYHEYPMSKDVYETCRDYAMIREQRIKELLKEDKVANTNAFFLTRKGKRIYDQYINNKLKKYAIEALGEEEGGKITAHSFRRALCTLLYDKTNDIYFVQKVIGHKNISTTELYIKDDTEEKRDRSVEIIDDIFHN